MFGSEPTMAWLFFGPSGRISRQPFNLALLFWILLMSGCISQMFQYQDDQNAFVVWVLALLVVSAAATLSSLMLAIKRLHDVGLSGFCVLLLFIPVVAAICTLLLMLWPSVAGPCRYGAASNLPQP